MRIKLTWFYLMILGWLVILGLLARFSQFNLTNLGFLLTFLSLILIPGFLLESIFNFSIETFSHKIFYWLTLGFSFQFLIATLGMIFNLSLNLVIVINLTLLLALWGLGFWRSSAKTLTINFLFIKKISFGDWLLIGLLIIGSIIAFLGVASLQEKIIGDAYFHLAILRKVVSAQSLSSYNLWVVKTTTINPVYGFPIWHIFVGELSRVLQINIFTAFSQILLPLVILALMTSFLVAKIFFQNKYLAAVCYLAFLAILLSAGVFYPLVPIRAPDSFNRLLFLPLLLGLTADYLYSKQQNYGKFILVILAAIFLGMIHLTHLIDYCLILILAIILILIISRDKLILKRLGFLLLAFSGLFVLFLLIFNWQNSRSLILHNIANFANISTSKNESYHNISIFYLYTIFALPLLFLFWRWRKPIVFLLAVPITLLAITLQSFHLRGIFLKYLGEVFTIRAITDIPYFLFFGFSIFLVIYFLNWLIERLPQIGQYLALIVFAGLLTFFLIIDKTPIFAFLYEVIFSAKKPLVYQYFIWLWLFFILLAVVLYLIFHFTKKEFSLDRIKNSLNFSVLCWLIFILLTSPYWSDFRTLRAQNSENLLASRQIDYYGEIDRLGGQETMDFLKKLPPPCVVATSNITAAQVILLYSSCVVQEYPYAVDEFTLAKKIYDPAISLEERLIILDKYSINYLVALKSEESQLFTNTQYFRKIYEKNFSYQYQSDGQTFQKDRQLVVFQYETNKPYFLDQFNLKRLAPADLPYTYEKIAPFVPDFPVDSDGIIIYNQQYYHPGQMAQVGLWYLDSFRKTQNKQYISLAEKYAQKLQSVAKDDHGAWFFPLNFDFALHEIKDDVLKAPWYSGMVQGEALAFFTRLFEVTKKPEYLHVAEKTFLSFLHLRDNYPNLWTVEVDQAGYYWIQEYPEENPDQTLNGFIFGLYGVYDYYLLKKDSSSQDILDAGLTTLKKYLPDFRVPGNISYYCLKHKKQSESYHQTHIEQLNMLYKITGDEFFKQMADNFYEDYH